MLRELTLCNIVESSVTYPRDLSSILENNDVSRNQETLPMIQEEGSSEAITVEQEVRQMHAGIRERENIRGMCAKGTW